MLGSTKSLLSSDFEIKMKETSRKKRSLYYFLFLSNSFVDLSEKIMINIRFFIRVRVKDRVPTFIKVKQKINLKRSTFCVKLIHDQFPG